MSSHHIVREKQEPALLVLGLDNFTDELLGQLLEWSPTVMVTADAAEALNAMGIKVDVIIDPDTDGLQSDIKTIGSNGDSVVDAALTYLVAGGYPAVNVVTDEFVVHDYLPYISDINVVIYHDDQKIFAVHSGFAKWQPAGEALCLLHIPQGLQTTGLTETAEGCYITTLDGFFTLRFNAPFVFIAESIL